MVSKKEDLTLFIAEEYAKLLKICENEGLESDFVAYVVSHITNASLYETMGKEGLERFQMKLIGKLGSENPSWTQTIH